MSKKEKAGFIAGKRFANKHSGEFKICSNQYGRTVKTTGKAASEYFFQVECGKPREYQNAFVDGMASV